MPGLRLTKAVFAFGKAKVEAFRGKKNVVSMEDPNNADTMRYGEQVKRRKERHHPFIIISQWRWGVDWEGKLRRRDNRTTRTSSSAS